MKHKEGRTVIDDVARSSAFATPSIAYVRRRLLLTDYIELCYGYDN